MIDQERQFFYQLLARLFHNLPDSTLLTLLQQLEPAGTDTALDLSLQKLVNQVKSPDLTQWDDDFHRLFIGLGRGEVMPYLSWYETGFLMEKPLADLRQTLKQLGIQRQPDNCEPEDHISALCEVMALLIQENHPEQHHFFSHYILTWTPALFADIQQADAGVFYPIVAELGHAFIQYEQQYH